VETALCGEAISKILIVEQRQDLTFAIKNPFVSGWKVSRTFRLLAPSGVPCAVITEY
jgi:hypothetical protein